MKKPLTLALLCISAQTFAANCTDAKTQMEMTACAGQEYAAQDKKLNAVYSQYRSRLDASQKNKLKGAQSAWIKFRDLSCDFESSRVEGGSVYPMVRYECLTEKTKIRLQEISRLMTCKEGDLSCPAPE